MTRRTPCQFLESLEEACEYQNGALAFLTKYTVPPNPAYYAIAYEYTAERSAALNAEVDGEITNTGQVDGYFLSDLFGRYFIQDQAEEIDGYIANLHEVFLNALQGVNNASDEVTEFGKILEAQRGRLESNPGIEGVKSIATTLMDATEQALANNQQLRSHLQDTESETSTMREELGRLRMEAVTDGLTGLYNRRELNNRLDELLDRGAGSDKPLSLLMLDIDHFKKVNDNFGHQIGDEVIRRVAKAVQEHAGGDGFAARYGGEEFALVMPETDINQAVEIGAAINEAVNKMVLVRRKTKQRLPPISISVGAASHKNGEDQDDLIGRADRALYYAKNNGRNQVVSDLQLAVKAQPL
ncbi:MAG: GGDEF domain-containing protein [Gammaproteobacteria bacterium]|nr:GGDEF domain-containing protein [Gammaproteobacteria bacterium]